MIENKKRIVPEFLDNEKVGEIPNEIFHLVITASMRYKEFLRHHVHIDFLKVELRKEKLWLYKE